MADVEKYVDEIDRMWRSGVADIIRRAQADTRAATLMHCSECIDVDADVPLSSLELNHQLDVKMARAWRHEADMISNAGGGEQTNTQAQGSSDRSQEQGTGAGHSATGSTAPAPAEGSNLHREALLRARNGWVLPPGPAGRCLVWFQDEDGWAVDEKNGVGIIWREAGTGNVAGDISPDIDPMLAELILLRNTGDKPGPVESGSSGVLVGVVDEVGPGLDVHPAPAPAEETTRDESCQQCGADDRVDCYCDRCESCTELMDEYTWRICEPCAALLSKAREHDREHAPPNDATAEPRGCPTPGACSCPPSEAAELARLRKLFTDAGSPECDVLRLVEFCQAEILRLRAEVKRLRDADAGLRAADKRRDEREERVRKILGAKGMESTEAAARRVLDNTRHLLDVMRGRFDGEAEYNAIMSVAEAFAGKAGE